MAAMHPLARLEPPPLKGVREVAAQIRDVADLAQLFSAGVISSAGVSVSTESASRFAAVASCDRVIGTAFSSVPLDLMRREANGDKAKDTGNPVYALLHDRPSEYQTSLQWRRVQMRDLLFRGSAYSLIVWGYGNRPVELIRLHPDAVSVDQDLRTGEISYSYSRRDGRRVKLQRRELLHVWGDSDDGIVGMNPIARFRETIGDGIAMREHGSFTFANGAKPSGQITAVAKITNKKDVLDDFRDNYTGVQNRGQVIVMDQGMKFEPVSMTNEDAQYIEARKFNRAEIAGIFGVPPHMIGDLDKATFSNIEHQAIQFVTGCMAPWFKCWEECLHRDVLQGDPARYVKFNERGLLRGDFKSQQEGLAIQRANEVITANEWRDVLDMNRRTDPGGDEYKNPNTAKPPSKPGDSSGAQPNA